MNLNKIIWSLTRHNKKIINTIKSIILGIIIIYNFNIDKHKIRNSIINLWIEARKKFTEIL
jgi:hypothetical protein